MGKSGKMDANMMQAAINRIGQMDQGEAARAMASLSKSDAFKNMSAKDRNRVIQTCLSQKGNPLMKSFGKALGKSQQNISFDDFAKDTSDNGLQKVLQGMGSDVFADMDKDVMSVIANSTDAGKGFGIKQEISQMFSNEQMAAAYGQGFTGTTGEKFNQVIKKRTGEQTEADLRSMTTQQFSKIKVSALSAALSTKRSDGSGANVAGSLSKQLADIQKENNSELLGSMDSTTRTYFGI
jgi:hypothetical protein